ncbi:hypothetical protein H6P81_016210 [Aristolochia fimbriata]|uniref:Transposase, Ptta/En/Spm, plant n=1 Tax=Aristolochia fimbriata TaxID=158543 RepID=A0AAV7E7L0_ARIFI|nr:hypothetical protein H6P81_016210 [Aristolochia fimbriata]
MEIPEELSFDIKVVNEYFLFEADETNASTHRRGRGPSKGTKVEEIYKLLGGTIPTNIGKNKRDERVYSKYLTHHVGNAVRSHLKLKVRKFKDLKDEDFTDADTFIQDKFDIDLAKEEHKDCIRGIMMDLYRKYRGWGTGAEEKYDEMFNAKERASQSGEVDEERIVADVLGYRPGYIKEQGTAQQRIPRGPHGISSSQQVEAMVTGIREEYVREIQTLKDENASMRVEHSQEIQQLQEENNKQKQEMQQLLDENRKLMQEMLEMIHSIQGTKRKNT